MHCVILCDFGSGVAHAVLIKRVSERVGCVHGECDSRKRRWQIGACGVVIDGRVIAGREREFVDYFLDARRSGEATLFLWRSAREKWLMVHAAAVAALLAQANRMIREFERVDYSFVRGRTRRQVGVHLVHGTVLATVFYLKKNIINNLKFNYSRDINLLNSKVTLIVEVQILVN